MTPDMKRLCDAMRIVFDAHYDGDATLDDDGAEALVYAVLTELKEPQKSFEDACCKRDICVAAGWESVGAWDVANEVVAAVVDHILADPVKA